MTHDEAGGVLSMLCACLSGSGMWMGMAYHSSFGFGMATFAALLSILMALLSAAERSRS